MSADKNPIAAEPADPDEPPFFPVADPDAPDGPDWEHVEPVGEQFPDAGDADEEGAGL